MKVNKQSFSEKSSENSSTQKSGCGCTGKESAKGSEEEIDIEIHK